MLQLSEPEDRQLAAPSQATFAYETIRRAIVSGIHTPGKKLKILDLAAELSVSPSAVREALSRLVPEQLVVAREQRGFAVAPLSVADLEDLTELRCEVEAIALRKSVELGGIEWEAGLIAAAHRMNATSPRLGTPTIAMNPDWISPHSSFHAALVSACGSRRLLALHAQLYEQSERYRGLSAPAAAERKIDEEHRQIVELALARNVEGLIAVTVEHIRTTTRLIVTAARADAMTMRVTA